VEHSYLDGWEPIGGLEIGRRYEHAPIVQAILEFQVQSAEDVPLTAFEQIPFGDDFLDAQPIFRMNAEIKVEPGHGSALASARQEAAGFMYPRRDQGRTIQAMPAHFTYIWHDQYTNWETLIDETEAAWTEYKRVAKPQLVHSIGARFVNMIPLPEKAVELRDYLRISVDIPAALPQGVRNLFAQVDIPMDKYDATCTITTTIADAAPERPGGGLLLDIDVRSSVEITTLDEAFDSAIRDKLDALRMAKNLVFEACITDATRERIK